MTLLGRRTAGRALGVIALGALGCKRRSDADADADADVRVGALGASGASPPSRAPDVSAPERAHRRPIERLVFADATTLISSSADAACVWDVARRRVLFRVPVAWPMGSMAGTNAADVDVPSKRLACGERGGVVIKTLDGRDVPVGGSTVLEGTLVGLGQRGESVITRLGATVVVRRLDDGRVLFSRADLGQASARSLSRDRRLAALQDQTKKRVTVVDVGTGDVVSTMDVLGNHPRFSEDDKAMVIEVAGALHVHDVSTGKERLRIPMPMESSDGRGQQPRPEDVTPLALARGMIVATHTPYELVTFDASTGQRKAFFPAPTLIHDPGTRIEATPDASTVVTVSSERLYRFDLDRSNLLSPHDITPPVPFAKRPLVGAAQSLTLGATTLAVAPDGRFVAFAGSQGLWIVDARSLRNEATLLDTP